MTGVETRKCPTQLGQCLSHKKGIVSLYTLKYVCCQTLTKTRPQWCNIFVKLVFLAEPFTGKGREGGGGSGLTSAFRAVKTKVLKLYFRLTEGRQPRRTENQCLIPRPKVKKGNIYEIL